MKLTTLVAILILAVGLLACGEGKKDKEGEGGAEDTTQTADKGDDQAAAEDAPEPQECPDNTSMTVSAKGLNTTKFEPKSIILEKDIGDYMVVHAFNFEVPEGQNLKSLKLQPGQLHLEMSLKNNEGDDVIPGEYVYDSEKKLYSVVSLHTADGEQYMHNLGGEPVASILVYDANSDYVCGNLDIDVAEGGDYGPLKIKGDYNFEFTQTP